MDPSQRIHQSPSKNLGSRKVRRKYFPYDKEHLYSEAIKLKNSMNDFREINMRLRNKVDEYSKELEEKDKIIHELMEKVTYQQESPEGVKIQRSDFPTHLIVAVKNQIKEKQDTLTIKDEEIAKLNKGFKSYPLQEIDIEIKMFIDESTRLKHIIEEILRQKAANYTPEDVETIKNKISQQTYLIETIKQQNEEVTKMLEKKNEEINNWRNVYEKLKEKITKLESEDKVSINNRSQLNETKR